MTPVTPPMTKVGMKPEANKLAVLNVICPPHIVNSQLKILIPVGTAISIVAIENKALAIGPIPVVNIWWAHTMKPRKAIRIVANTIELYPNKRFREKVLTTSEMMPNAGRISMYTSGWPKIQISRLQSVESQGVEHD